MKRSIATDIVTYAQTMLAKQIIVFGLRPCVCQC